MLVRYVSVVVSHISERTSGSEYDILALEFAFSQLHIFLFVDELTRSEFKARLRNICGT